jgi:hypothetical protein
MEAIIVVMLDQLPVDGRHRHKHSVVITITIVQE